MWLDSLFSQHFYPVSLAFMCIIKRWDLLVFLLKSSCSWSKKDSANMSSLILPEGLQRNSFLFKKILKKSSSTMLYYVQPTQFNLHPSSPSGVDGIITWILGNLLDKYRNVRKHLWHRIINLFGNCCFGFFALFSSMYNVLLWLYNYRAVLSVLQI